MLAKSELKEALSDSLRTIGRAYDELSVIVANAADLDEQEVIYPLQEQIRIIASVLNNVYVYICLFYLFFAFCFCVISCLGI